MGVAADRHSLGYDRLLGWSACCLRCDLVRRLSAIHTLHLCLPPPSACMPQYLPDDEPKDEDKGAHSQ